LQQQQQQHSSSSRKQGGERTDRYVQKVGVMFSRRGLLPLVKVIHPDLFAQASSAVQKANLNALQTLTEIWDGLEKAKTRVATRPLRKQYIIECYVHEREPLIAREEVSEKRDEPVSKLGLRKIRLDLRPPGVLCEDVSVVQKQNDQHVHQKVKDQALDNVCRQLEAFFASAGLLSPWKDKNVDKKEGEWERVAGQRDEKRRQSALPTQAEVDAMLFERIITSKHRQAFSVFDFGKKGKLATRLVQNQVDEFIQTGHVLVQNVPLHAEIDVLEKLRDFLTEYGTVLNFSTTSWKNVVLILCGPKEQFEAEEFISSKQRQAAMYKIAVQQGKTSKSGICETIFIINAPSNFRDKLLLEHVRKSLPKSIISCFDQGDFGQEVIDPLL